MQGITSKAIRKQLAVRHPKSAPQRPEKTCRAELKRLAHGLLCAGRIRKLALLQKSPEAMVCPGEGGGSQLPPPSPGSLVRKRPRVFLRSKHHCSADRTVGGRGQKQGQAGNSTKTILLKALRRRLKACVMSHAVACRRLLSSVQCQNMYDAGLRHPPSPPPTPWYPPRGGTLSPRIPTLAPVVSLLWWALHPLS